jgi:hypothetical protein
MAHHTKDKGDLGVAMVIADLAQRGYGACLPLAEHLPFDIVAVSPDQRIARVQVKYAKTVRHAFFLKLMSSYASVRGNKTKRIDTGTVDGWAVYNPEAGVIYVPAAEAEGMLSGMTFRISKTGFKNDSVRLVRDYKDPSVLWRAQQDSNLQPAD